MSRECNSLSYDAMTAHTAVVFTRYMMLSLESRESNDNRSLIIKKENEGKSRKQAKIAGLNKFLQIYYARVMEIYKNIA